MFNTYIHIYTYYKSRYKGKKVRAQTGHSAGSKTVKYTLASTGADKHTLTVHSVYTRRE